MHCCLQLEQLVANAGVWRQGLSCCWWQSISDSFRKGSAHTANVQRFQFCSLCERLDKQGKYHSAVCKSLFILFTYLHRVMLRERFGATWWEKWGFACKDWHFLCFDRGQTVLECKSPAKTSETKGTRVQTCNHFFCFRGLLRHVFIPAYVNVGIFASLKAHIYTANADKNSCATVILIILNNMFHEATLEGFLRKKQICNFFWHHYLFIYWIGRNT